MLQLPPAKQDLPRHTQEPSKTDTRRITYRRSAERELPVLLRDAFTNFSKSVDIYKTTKQTLPEYDDEYEVDVRDEVEHRVEGKEYEVKNLEQGG